MKALLIAAVLVGTALPAAAQPPPQARYQLGPQDRLMIRVHSLRRATGESYAWTPLNGEFAVGADGAVSLPIVGPLRAAGGTAADLAEAIGRALRETANLSEAPTASVEVVRHRPFFVTGSVQQPGRYEFEPGMTVLQALSTARGLARAADTANVERELVLAGGDLRVLEAERIALDAKLARFNAEIADAPAISFPAALVARRSDARVATAMQEETARFEGRRAAVKAEIEAIEQNKTLLAQELKSLEEKGRSLDRQIEVNKRELRLVSDLVSRGLTVTPRQLAAENAQVMIESNRLDVQVATLRAQQALARSARDVVEVRTKYRKEAMDEAAAARVALDQNIERARTADKLMRESESRSPASRADAEEAAPIYRLTRSSPSGSRTWVAAEDSLLEPGDVLQVSLPRSGRPAAAALR